MSIIQNIRNKYAKVAGGVIAVSLIAFVLNDAFSGGSGSGSGTMAKVNGEKIEPMDFDRRIREYNTVYSISNQGKTITDEVAAQIREQALRDLVNEEIINKELDKLGIVVSAKEEKELVEGPNYSPMIMQYPVFTNPETGAFDVNRVKQYNDQLNNPPANSDMNQIQKERENWANFKSFVLHQSKMQKFNNLIGASMYSPKFMVDYKMASQNEMASIRLVKVPNTVIPDNEVTVSDADINDYVAKHKKRFENATETRGIDYVAFDIVPSSLDTANTFASLEQIKNEFGTTTSTGMEAFVSRYSEQAYRDFYFTKKTFQSPYADSILGKVDGTVYGPYLEGGSMLLVKVLEHRAMADSVKAQHILIQPSQTMDDSAAHKLADSLLMAVQSGVSFDSLARQFSIDSRNNNNGGDLGYIPYGTDNVFDEFIFKENVGDTKVLKTQAGYHVVRINDQKDIATATKLAIVVKSLFPSEATETEIFTKANTFASKYKTTAAFAEGVKAMGVQKREAANVKVQDFSIAALGPARDIVRWMYSAKQGDVSEVLNVTTPIKRYIIANLTNIQEKGLVKINSSNKPEIESIIRAEKKADKIVEKFKSQTTLEGIAQASGQQILAADSFTSTAPYLENIGYEAKAIGYTFSKSAKVGTLAPPMKGADGVSYMIIDSKTPKVANPNEAMVFQQQQMMEQQQQQRGLGQTLQDMMMRRSKITYNNENIR